jgi:hypothetical protein
MNPEKTLTTEKPMNTKKCDCSGRPLGTDKCETCQSADADMRRLVRRWWDVEYPVIARLDEKWDLIAHQNGPAMTDGDTLSSIDTHPDDFRETMMVKMKAQAAWREYSWPLLREGFYPTNAGVLAHADENLSNQ